MTIRIKVRIYALLAAGFFSSFTAAAASRDAGADVLKIATRFMENYSKVQHKAGDADGVFIEDVVIPSVVGVADSYKGEIPSATRGELYRFLIAGKSMASEELSGLAATIYLSSPQQFCRDVTRLGKTDRNFLIQQANSGLALNDMKPSKVSCGQAAAR